MVGGSAEAEQTNDDSYLADFSEIGGYSNNYLQKMSRLGIYGDGIVLANASCLYKRPLFYRTTPRLFEPLEVSDAEPIQLGWLAVGDNKLEKNHYVSVIARCRSG